MRPNYEALINYVWFDTMSALRGYLRFLYMGLDEGQG